MMFNNNVIMEYMVFLDRSSINAVFPAEAVSSPMFSCDGRVLRFKVETRNAFLHFSSLLLFSTFLPVAFFLTPAWNPNERRIPC